MTIRLFAAYGLVILLLGLGYLGVSLAWRERRDLSAAPASGRQVPTGDGFLYAQFRGAQTGIPVVFIHGTAAWSENWIPTMQALELEGMRSIAFDIPPSGASSTPKGADYGRAAQGQRIKQALDHLQIGEAILAGHSFGGHVTFGAYEALGDRVKGLILVAAATGLPTQQGDPVTEAPGWLGALMKSEIARDFLASVFTHRFFTKPVLKMSIHNPAIITPELIGVYRDAVSFEGANQRFADWLPLLLTPTDHSLATNDDFYRAIKVPTLIVWGDKDNLTPPWQAERLKNLIPGSRLEYLENVGHFPHIEDPVGFRKVLMNYLNFFK